MLGCVEIYLNQPVVGKVGGCGQWYNVQYEGLHIICSQCGCYGHVLNDCKVPPPVDVQGSTMVHGQSENPHGEGKSVEDPQIVVQNPVPNIGEEILGALHRDWLIVSRKKQPSKFATNVGPKSKGKVYMGVSNVYEILHKDMHEEISREKIVSPTAPLGDVKRASNRTGFQKKQPRKESGGSSSFNVNRVNDPVSKQPISVNPYIRKEGEVKKVGGISNEGSRPIEKVKGAPPT